MLEEIDFTDGQSRVAALIEDYPVDDYPVFSKEQEAAMRAIVARETEAALAKFADVTERQDRIFRELAEIGDALGKFASVVARQDQMFRELATAAGKDTAQLSERLQVLEALVTASKGVSLPFDEEQAKAA